MLPTARRRTYRPASFVWERNTSPDSFTRERMRSLIALSVSSCTPDGAYRKQTSEKCTAAATSHSGSARRDAAVGAVDVTPQRFALADLGDRGDGIDAGRARRPHRRHACEREKALRAVVVDDPREGVGTHPQLVVDRDMDEILEPEAERQRRLVDRRVRVLRGVNAESRQIGASSHAARPNRELRFGLARGREREERRNRRRVVQKPEPAAGQAEHLAQPIGGHFLELRPGWPPSPQHGLHVERGDQHLAEDARDGGGGREVAEEPRMIPVGDARNDLLLEIAKDTANGLTLLGR